MIDNVIPSNFHRNNCPIRVARTFVRRQGRLTKGQRQALKIYWPVIGVEYQSEFINITKLFDQFGPIVLEIGFGMGGSLVSTAEDNPKKNFLGIEVYLPGVGACLASAYASRLSNLRLICHDAIEVLQNMIENNSLDALHLFFPDPWHKTRHNKRRIVQPPFVELVRKKLKIGGIFHMATDWRPYAIHMLRIVNEVSGYQNLSSNNDYLLRPPARPVTKFELRGQRLGHSIWDLIFERRQ